MRVNLQDNAPPTAAVPTIRSAMRDIFLPPEMYRPVTALAGLGDYFSFIDEHSAVIIPFCLLQARSLLVPTAAG